MNSRYNSTLLPLYSELFINTLQSSPSFALPLLPPNTIPFTTPLTFTSYFVTLTVPLTPSHLSMISMLHPHYFYFFLFLLYTSPDLRFSLFDSSSLPTHLSSPIYPSASSELHIDYFGSPSSLSSLSPSPLPLPTTTTPLTQPQQNRKRIGFTRDKPAGKFFWSWLIPLSLFTWMTS